MQEKTESTSTAANEECPVKGGILGSDWQLHDECSDCALQDRCKRLHDKAAVNIKQDELDIRQIPVYPALLEELYTTAALVVSMILYRQNRFDYCTDSRAQIAQLLRKSPARITQLLKPGDRKSLVARGYVESVPVKQRRGNGEPWQRTKLRATVKTLRIVNRNRRTTDQIIGPKVKHT